jgi:hypothetical protein
MTTICPVESQYLAGPAIGRLPNARIGRMLTSLHQSGKK